MDREKRPDNTIELEEVGKGIKKVEEQLDSGLISGDAVKELGEELDDLRQKRRILKGIDGEI